MLRPTIQSAVLILMMGAAQLPAGPYSQALNDPSNPHDAPVPGFLGPEGIGKARYSMGFDNEGQEVFTNPLNHLNPLFFDWASEVVDYTASEAVAYYYGNLYLDFGTASLALGPVTGDHWDVVSLGDMTLAQMQGLQNPGTITIKLTKPVQNLTGADFVVFENGSIAQSNQGGAGTGGIFGELAYVEVSANGIDFIRFPSDSLTAAAVGSYGSIDPTNVHNLAGKHVNKDDSWGTPFDLSSVGLPQITHVRIVDIPGNGSFTDPTGHSIYDAWKTFGSGGFDLEAIGAISSFMTFAEWPQLQLLPAEERGADKDPDADGMINLLEYAFNTLPWKPDTAPQSILFTNGAAEISFTRDERLTDLTYEVQSASGMQGWTTIASSNAGAPIQGANGHTPAITESSAETIQSIGVIRKVTVRDDAPGNRRFFRVKVTSTSASISNE